MVGGSLKGSKKDTPTEIYIFEGKTRNKQSESTTTVGEMSERFHFRYLHDLLSRWRSQPVLKSNISVRPAID